MKKIASQYLVVLAVLTLVILGSQVLMQQTIKGSKSDSRIVNISGRQRMLSQKIAKSSLKLRNAIRSQEFNRAHTELAEALALWSQSHADLQYGSEEIDVAEMNQSEVLMSLFKDIEPYFQRIKKAAQHLIDTRFYDLSNEERMLAIEQNLNEIIAHESEFLNLMNKITFQHDKLASRKIESLSSIEYFLMAFTFLLILLEAIFIFKPMFVESRKKELALSEINLLREDERSFSASQIKQANQKIQQLNKVAIKFRDQLIEKEKEFGARSAHQMNKNLEQSAKLEEVQKANMVLKKELERLKNNNSQALEYG